MRWDGIQDGIRGGSVQGWAALLDLVLPVECAGCGTRGTSWCPRCAASLGAPYRVVAPCCPVDPPVYALGAYQGRLRDAVLAYKDGGRRDLAGPLGVALADALRCPQFAAVLGRNSEGGGRGSGSGGLCLVPVPSRWSAAVRRGGQHMALLADRAAAALAAAGVPAAVGPALRMACGVRDSVGLDRAARRRNLTGRVLVRPAGLPPAGSTVVVVDDVVTTGTTMSTCVTTLAHMGVQVSAVVALAVAGGDGK